MISCIQNQLIFPRRSYFPGYSAIPNIFFIINLFTEIEILNYTKITIEINVNIGSLKT